MCETHNYIKHKNVAYDARWKSLVDIDSYKIQWSFLKSCKNSLFLMKMKKNADYIDTRFFDTCSNN